MEIVLDIVFLNAWQFLVVKTCHRNHEDMVRDDSRSCQYDLVARILFGGVGNVDIASAFDHSGVHVQISLLMKHQYCNAGTS